MSLKKLLIPIRYFPYFHNKRIRIGKDFSCRRNLILKCEKGGNLTIGDHVFFNNSCSVYCLNKITIGNNVLIGENVHFYDHNHRFNRKGTKIQDSGRSLGEIHIGDNVWIGTGCVILPGTWIGENSVIGAGCVIHGIVPKNSVVKNNGNRKVEEIRFKDLS